MKAKNSLRELLCPNIKRKKLNFPIQSSFLLLLFFLTAISSYGQGKRTISGTVISATDNKPLTGATVKTDLSTATVQTNDRGHFIVAVTRSSGKLTISYIGYKTVEISFNNLSTEPLNIVLEPNATHLDGVTVSTGFQTLPKERATGSFSVVNNELFNRSVSTDVISRLNGVTSGLVFDKSSGNNLGITVRGKSTIWANTQPLVILDNFPYEGDMNNINPNDVENITVLKDAAAASIWGTRAGNGVIVITTKKGKYNQPVKVSFNSNITIGEKPDLFYEKKMSSKEFIEVEQFLFQKGNYDGYISDGYTALTPAVEVMIKAKAGTISALESAALLNELAGHDLRNDLLKYFYQRSTNQQYALNLNGGSENQQYYISGGWDKNLSNAVGNQYDRVSLNANNTYSLLNHKLEITTGILFTKSTSQNNSVDPVFGGGGIYPYAALADRNSNALPIAQYRNGFLGDNPNSSLLDWTYKPLDELKFADNETQVADYQASLGLKYKIIPSLNVEVKYRYGNGSTLNRNHRDQRTYYTRDLINSYTQVDATTGALTRPVPLGDLLGLSNGKYTAQNLRGQLNYELQWKNKSHLHMIVGSEIGETNTNSDSHLLYGYDPNRETSLPMDFLGSYVRYVEGYPTLIPSGLSLTKLTNRTISFFGNAAYTFSDRYTISASARSDGSNLFGVRTNQKWAPLWSVGTGWEISHEPFYHSLLLPSLKLRATYGYNGNIDKNVTAFLTTRITSNNRYGSIYSRVVNPPNPYLTWERVGQLNVGLDFGFRNNIITGSIEYYQKNGSDMIGDATLPPSSGYTNFRGNSASIKGRGFDLTLNSTIINTKLNWSVSALFSNAKTWISDYKVQPTTNSNYLSGLFPKMGGDMSGIYVYKWAGLDPLTGAPRGYLNGEVSADYTRMALSNNLKDLKYVGPSAPPYYGSLLNRFSYEGFSLSFNLLYKFGYYFQRPSINYLNLFSGTSGYGHSDYTKRWQKSGDELTTNVPSLVYPAVANRDSFYAYSEVLVEKGDHIRLQDIQLSYDLSKKYFPALPFRNVKLYVYASNIGVIWRANNQGLDPDAGLFPQPRTTALGLKIDL